ncbi:hypothetical protein O181_014888 [Austropuccinia psidii MF-1]|uniref:SNF2 N-terminal domain-containing protein n=1 Tax=Austropuccinia psidii MF-1 TaxID=1389203 RepID=A0A9Q3C1E9_9BASI|nr:hypothetical protein [Austropuccinia psidii MF-1]
MSTFYYNISHFKLDATLILCSLSIYFQAKTDTISQCIRPFHDDPSLIKKTRLAFLWDREICNGKSTHNLWPSSPPGLTFNARQKITNKLISSFESLLTSTPLGGLLPDDMGLGKLIQAIALIGTSKEWLITRPQGSMPTLLNHQLAIRNIHEFSGWGPASQNLPWPHLPLIVQDQYLTMLYNHYFLQYYRQVI